MIKKLEFMIVVGEASGDTHAAKLVKRMRELAPDATFFGATGARMREEGVETIVRADDLSIIGILDIARALPMFWQTFRKLKRVAFERKPEAVILVDFPDFNLKLAKALKKVGIKTIYYISPQVWAWKKYRVKTIRENVDLMLTILPFEKKWFSEQGVFQVEYVGNPLAGEIKPKTTQQEFCEKHKLDDAKPIVALLPGSRYREIQKILPPLIETASFMAEKKPELQFVVALASSQRVREVNLLIENRKLKLPENLLIVAEETREALNAADVAAVTSGTATLETGIIGTPMAIVYKASALNYKVLRPFINVPHFGLINLIAQDRLAKELIQDDFTKETLAEELFRLLEPDENAKVRERLREVTDTLGRGGTAKRAAQAIMTVINKESRSDN